MKKFIAALFLLFLASGPASAADKSESVLDRIQRTGTIRCGYIVYPPYLLRDPNTGEISGPAYDLINAIAEELEVKAEWTEETGWGNFAEGLNADRYDMMCVAVWQSGLRAKIASLSRPVYYNALYAFSRADDSRFSSGLDSIDRPDVTVSTVDGDITQAVKKMHFSRAKELALPQTADGSQMPLSVATKKADIALDNATNIETFNRSSETKLKRVGGGKPVRLFGNVYAVKRGEFALKLALDASIEALATSGRLEGILKTHSSADLHPIAPGYSESEN